MMCRLPELLTKAVEQRAAACAQYSVRVEAGLGCKQSCRLPAKKELPVSQSCEGVKVCGLRAQLFYSTLDSKSLEDVKKKKKNIQKETVWCRRCRTASVMCIQKRFAVTFTQRWCHNHAEHLLLYFLCLF